MSNLNEANAANQVNLLKTTTDIKRLKRTLLALIVKSSKSEDFTEAEIEDLVILSGFLDQIDK